LFFALSQKREGERKMKKIFAAIIIGVLCLSVFSIMSFAPAGHASNPAPDRLINAAAVTDVSSSVPNSAMVASPPPVPPITTPIVVTLLVNYTGTGSVTGSFAAPSGMWAMILMNYTGEATGLVYDSSFRFVVNDVEVFAGTSPEYGRWVVLKDLTEYVSLFKGTVSYTFAPPSAVVVGYFSTWLSLSFYPVPRGSTPPVEPDTIIPLWSPISLTPSSPSSTVTVTVPTNVKNATLELYLYGFGVDEFWYADEPSYRDLFVSVGSNPIVSVLPFPYINTGGIDLFMWRPIPAVFTLNDRPYQLDVTPALGMLEGTHSLTVNVTGISPGSYWVVSGALLLQTSSSALPAKQISYSFPAPSVTTETNAAFTYFNQTANLRYSYSSLLPRSSGISTTASESVTEYFQNNQTFNAVWENITGLESTVINEKYTSRQADCTTTTNTVESISYPLAMDTGQVLTITSTTSGGYPMYGTISILLFNLLQEWRQSTVETTMGQNTQTTRMFDETVTGTNGNTTGTIELISPIAGIITAITFISANTAAQALYIQPAFPDGSVSMFMHIIVGVSYQPPAPYYAETIVLDKIIKEG
jgi:hypothetical protein